MQKRLGVIGCGLRSEAYLKWMSSAIPERFELAAIADPAAGRRATFVGRYGSEATAEFDSGEALIAEAGDRLDGIIIATPNNQHAQHAVPAFRLGIPVLLEKPIAPTRAECSAIWDAWVESGRPPVLVGFVLRYAAFYQTIAQLVDSARLGRLLSVSAGELMGPSLTALFMRGWRRDGSIAGPLINEKCSHDLDVLARIIGAVPTRVQSFGNRTRFVPVEGAGPRCGECAVRADCRYDAARLPRYELVPSEGVTDATPPGAPAFDDCVFTEHASILDNQVAILEYPNGVLATFVVTMDQPRTTRTITICGTEGRLDGVFEDDELVLSTFADGEAHQERIPLQHDESAHGGGDSRIAAQFGKLLLGGEREAKEATLAEGIQACLIGFGIERARESGEVFEVEQIGDWPH